MKSIHEEITNDNLAAGTNTLSSLAAVSARVNKITNISFSYTGTVLNVRIEIKAGGKSVYKTTADPVSGQLERLPAPVELYLSAGEKIDMVVTNATVGDDATLIINGVELIA